MAEVKEIAMNQSELYIEDVDRALEHVVGVERLCNKSVLITGATGTIGSFAADALIRLNYKNNANNRIYLGGRNIEKLRHQVQLLKQRRRPQLTLVKLRNRRLRL